MELQDVSAKSPLRQDLEIFYGDIYKAAAEGNSIERIAQLFGTTPLMIANILRGVYGVK